MKKNLCSLLAKTESNLSGQAMIEFTLIMSVIILLTVGVMDLARAVYAYGVISNAARNGAHYGALDATNTSDITQRTLKNVAGLEQDRITIGIQCVLNPGNPYWPMNPEDPDYADYVADHPDYPVYLEMHTCDPWNYLSVTVYYEFQPITLLFQPISMYSQSQMMIE